MIRVRMLGLPLTLSIALLGAGGSLVVAQSGDDASPPASDPEVATLTAEAEEREAKRAIIEAYVEALVSGDFGAVPMTEDVTFQNPYMSEPISGRETVQAYEEENFSSTIDDVQDGVVIIVDGDEAAAIFVLEMTKGWLVPTADYFRFEDGMIAEIRPYFDTAIFTTDPPAAD